MGVGFSDLCACGVGRGVFEHVFGVEVDVQFRDDFDDHLVG